MHLKASGFTKILPKTVKMCSKRFTNNFLSNSHDFKKPRARISQKTVNVNKPYIYFFLKTAKNTLKTDVKFFPPLHPTFMPTMR